MENSISSIPCTCSAPLQRKNKQTTKKLNRKHIFAHNWLPRLCKFVESCKKLSHLTNICQVHSFLLIRAFRRYRRLEWRNGRWILLYWFNCSIIVKNKFISIQKSYPFLTQFSDSQVCFINSAQFSFIFFNFYISQIFSLFLFSITTFLSRGNRN